ncbi:MAG: pyrimidine 5'-nucleotidase [Betaproteobacteria bacterium TMED156]|nr:MAG: pyrimidine 5'-nucleotidase [Betaproteobacteria bacterium TMED156]
MIIAKKNLCWFFDLDDTLHDASNGPLKMIDVMMTIEIQKLLKVDKKKADEIRKNYWKKFGATVVGMEKLHAISVSNFLGQTHTLDELSINVIANKNLSKRLKNLKGRKWLVTNSPKKYAHNVLKILKIKSCFERIIPIEKMRASAGIKPKPNIVQWKRLVRLSGVKASEVTVVDDCLKNLKSAKKLGCKTIWAQCYRSQSRIAQFLTPIFIDRKIKKISDLVRT